MNDWEQQRPRRVQTSIEAVLLGADGGETPVQVTDLSSGGFRLSGASGLVVGQQVQLRVSRYGDFPAKIQWVKGEDAGGLFLEPVAVF